MLELAHVLGRATWSPKETHTFGAFSSQRFTPEPRTPRVLGCGQSTGQLVQQFVSTLDQSLVHLNSLRRAFDSFASAYRGRRLLARVLAPLICRRCLSAVAPTAGLAVSRVVLL